MIIRQKSELKSLILFVIALIFCLSTYIDAVVVKEGVTDQDILDLGSQFPSVVSIHYEVSPNRIGICSGNMISSQVILTAAHCVRSQVSQPSFTLNYLNQEAGQFKTLSQLDASVFVPNGIGPYGNYELLKDFAVIVLETPIQVQTSKLLPKQASLQVGQNVFVAGFGEYGEINDIQQDLDLSQVRAAQNSLETLVFSGEEQERLSLCFNQNLNVENCQYVSRDLEGNIAQGDSGGPLFVYFQGNLYQAAVASHLLQKNSGNRYNYGDEGIFSGIRGNSSWIYSRFPVQNVASKSSGLWDQIDWLNVLDQTIKPEDMFEYQTTKKRFPNAIEFKQSCQNMFRYFDPSRSKTVTDLFNTNCSVTRNFFVDIKDQVTLNQDVKLLGLNVKPAATLSIEPNFYLYLGQISTYLDSNFNLINASELNLEGNLATTSVLNVGEMQLGAELYTNLLHNKGDLIIKDSVIMGFDKEKTLVQNSASLVFDSSQKIPITFQVKGSFIQKKDASLGIQPRLAMRIFPTQSDQMLVSDNVNIEGGDLLLTVKKSTKSQEIFRVGQDYSYNLFGDETQVNNLNFEQIDVVFDEQISLNYSFDAQQSRFYFLNPNYFNYITETKVKQFAKDLDASLKNIPNEIQKNFFDPLNNISTSNIELVFSEFVKDSFLEWGVLNIQRQNLALQNLMNQSNQRQLLTYYTRANSKKLGDLQHIGAQLQLSLPVLDLFSITAFSARQLDLATMNQNGVSISAIKSLNLKGSKGVGFSPFLGLQAAWYKSKKYVSRSYAFLNDQDTFYADSQGMDTTLSFGAKFWHSIPFIAFDHQFNYAYQTASLAAYDEPDSQQFPRFSYDALKQNVQSLNWKTQAKFTFDTLKKGLDLRVIYQAKHVFKPDALKINQGLMGTQARSSYTVQSDLDLNQQALGLSFDYKIQPAFAFNGSVIYDFLQSNLNYSSQFSFYF